MKKPKVGDIVVCEKKDVYGVWTWVDEMNSAVGLTGIVEPKGPNWQDDFEKHSRVKFYIPEEGHGFIYTDRSLRPATKKEIQGFNLVRTINNLSQNVTLQGKKSRTSK